MHCSCSQRAAANEWMQNAIHNKYPSSTPLTKSRESLTSRKSSLKTPSKPGSSSSLNRQSRNRQEQQRSATLPRSTSNPRHRTTPNVSTIFNDSIANSNVNLHQQTNSSYYRQRRKSDMAPWHRKSADAQKCTCRNSCYFCELNYPKVINNNFSTSTNALSFSNQPLPATSSYSINNLNYMQHQNIPTNNSALNLHQYSFPNNNHKNNLATNYHHHHSMINLNHIGANTKSTEMAENSPPIPAPPIPPLNPSCARCRFTANSSSNPTINCSQNGVGCGLSNQNSAPGFTASAVVAPVATMSDNVAANCFAGEFYDWIIACTKFSLFGGWMVRGKFVTLKVNFP